MKTLFLIHHSHTDIGYTDAQTTVRSNQIGFLRQVLDILDRRGSGCGFRWTCESFWAVEQFLLEADEELKQRFIQAIDAGDIGLSASYANFSELLGEEALARLTARAVEFARGIDQDLKSAMTADINGFGWGFNQALHTNGVTNLFTCIHTHHGMFPLRRHRPFWWEGPTGDQVLVWNGEHYHLGNELGLAPGAVSSYLIKDECDAETIYHDPWKTACVRIPRLFRQLEEDGYPYDFLPVMISGLRSDNGPPSEAILDQVERWNQAHGHEIQVEMTTLDAFFDRLRAEETSIPVHRGDWPDWWTDGTASMPAATASFREAQRIWSVWRDLRKLNRNVEAHDGIHLTEERFLDNLALYAEHTYGHAASVVQPHDPLVRTLADRKRAYASLADEGARDLLAHELSRRGRAAQAVDLPFRYRVINPHSVRITDVARLRIEHHEYYERYVYKGVRVVDEVSGEILPSGCHPTPVTTTLLVAITLDPGEERTLRIEPTMSRNLTPDQGRPVLESRELKEKTGRFETDNFLITWSVPEGITSWIDRKSGEELLRPDRDHAPFLPVSVRTEMAGPDDAWSVRGEMGLSRCGPDAEFSVGRVRSVREFFGGSAPGDPVEGDSENPIYRRLEFVIETDGCGESSLVLEAITGRPRIDVSFQINQQNSWAPQNLYLSLPFGSGAQAEVILDKAGGPVCARVDQLPGSLIDFYAVQDGFLCSNGKRSVAVSMRDNPLLQLGPLEYVEERRLHDPACRHPDRALPYAWLMTNYWETNFAAGLGGFHCFRFGVFLPESAELGQVVGQLRAANSGLVTFRLSD